MSQAFLYRCTPILSRRLSLRSLSSSRTPSLFSKQSPSRLTRLGAARKRPRSTLTGTCPVTCAGLSSIHHPSTSLESAITLGDTIFALSSGAGVTAGVAIIRVSGPAATICLAQLLNIKSKGNPASNQKFPQPRYASVRRLYHPVTSDLLDEALVIYFPGPRSFTGEDVVELHVHGSRAVINAVIEALSSLRQMHSDASTVRPAERGEFTRRAFENGRMDLTSVEGLADLISAETALQRKQALRQLGGEMRHLLEGWRAEIKSCLAHAEAVIDFGDDVDDDAFEAIVPRVCDLLMKMKGQLNDGHRGELVRGGARVAIVGQPNAGKSTLLNALARRPAAIVSPQAGTTRDVVEVHLDLNGLAVVVSDTAGLRQDTADPIEIEGMKRARQAASNADITILVHDASQGGMESAIESISMDRRGRENDTETGTHANMICVANKVDLMPDSFESKTTVGDIPIFSTSLVNNDGLSELTTHLENLLKIRLEGSGGVGEDSESSSKAQGSIPVITRARHRHHMTLAVEALSVFMEGRTGDNPLLYLPMDIATEELRIAAKEIGSITGIIHVEEVLDVVFSEFCIGK